MTDAREGAGRSFSVCDGLVAGSAGQLLDNRSVWAAHVDLFLPLATAFLLFAEGFAVMGITILIDLLVDVLSPAAGDLKI